LRGLKEGKVGILVGLMVIQLSVLDCQLGIEGVQEVLLQLLPLQPRHELILLVRVSLEASFVPLHEVKFHLPELVDHPQFFVVRRLLLILFDPLLVADDLF
jgi:hypothetical protein